MEQVTTIGLDIAKHFFQVHGINATGKVLIRRKHSARAALRDVIGTVEGVTWRCVWHRQGRYRSYVWL